MCNVAPVGDWQIQEGSFQHMDEKNNISMTDISRMAGVSVATVSRIINQNGRYSEETERRVRALIEKYHYTPNMTAKGLKTKRSNFVGILVPDITNDFFSCIVQEIQNGLRVHGYMAFVCNTAENEEIERQYMSMLGAVNLSGLIFISGNTCELKNGLHRLPAIYIDRVPMTGSGEVTVIESDNYGGAKLAVQELYDRGCRRIACIRSSKVISTYNSRYSGYRDQLALYGLQADPELDMRVDDISFQAARQAVNELIEQGKCFDGIFCTADWLALGALDALRAHQVAVPDDVKIVGFDDIAMASLGAKPLTTIHQQTDVLGQTAAEEIVKMMQGSPDRKHRVLVDVSLVRRKTT